MNTHHAIAARWAVTACLLALSAAGAHAAVAYNQTWSGASTEGWEGNTISSVVVHDAGVGNPAGSVVTRFDSSRASFDIGFTSGALAATSGSFAGSPWQVSFDLQLNEGKYTDVWLRYRYQDATFNGWRHALTGPFDQYNTWTNYSVNFDPSWTDVQASANGWFQEAGPTVSFSQTMGDVYKTEIRFALSDASNSGVAHLDNFVQAPVPEPKTWALMLAGLLMMMRLSRSRDED